MSSYARIQNGVVAELFTPPTGFTLAQCFTPDVVAQFVNADAITPAPQVGWTATEANGVWVFAAPVAQAINFAPLAQAALDKSDVTIIRCYEHAVAVPAAWTAYRTALRAIVSGASVVTALPAEPAYPAGT